MPDEKAGPTLPAQPSKPLAPNQEIPKQETTIPLEPVRTGASGGTESAPVRTAQAPAKPPISGPKPLIAVPRQPTVHTVAARPSAPATSLQPKTGPDPNAVGVASMQAFGAKPGARADCIYGETGAVKTTQLGWIADWIKSRFGKNSRLVSADAGGWESIQELVKTPDNASGIIEAFALAQHREHMYETMEKLTLGWWPKNVNDPQSPLVPPAQNGLKDIGGMFYEGLTSFCAIMMRTNTTDLKNINVPRSAAEKENLIKSGEFEHRFSSQTDYGSIQNIIEEFVRNSGMLPVVKTVWTALEQKGEDDNKRPVYGPDIIGKKATGQCGSWFGNLIHIDKVNMNVTVDDPLDKTKKITMVQVRPVMFTRAHIDPNDPTKLSWPAKTRAPRMFWNKIPDIMEPRMDKLYELLDQIRKEAIAARQKSVASAQTT